MADRKYVFGPVPSRRLGLSLGIDMVPRKFCTLDCIYCQVGRTTDKSVMRGKFVDLEQLEQELVDAVENGPQPDYVTLSGSGEPTLNAQMGEIIARIHDIVGVPIALITNSTLFSRTDVRHEAAGADLVVPSLDAGSQEVYARINRPHADAGVQLDEIVEGLVSFRGEFRGQIWLEVFFVEGINDDDQEVERIAAHIKRIKPDRIQLNTATRPTAEQDVRPVSAERLQQIAERLGPKAEVIASFKARGSDDSHALSPQQVLEMIRRRPVTAEDIAAGLGAHPHEVAKALGVLLERGQVRPVQKPAGTFYESNSGETENAD